MPKRMLAVLLALSFFVVACGDDDDTDTDSGTEDIDGGTDTDGDADEGGDGGEGDDDEVAFVGEFCADYMTMLAGEPGPAEIRTVAEVAPEAAKAAMATIAAGFEDDPDGFFTTAEFNENFAIVGQAAVDECADGELTATAVDYAFQDLPAEIDAGIYGITLENEGTEMHEIVVFRKNDDTTESFDEILAMEDEGAAQGLITFIGASFAPPGGSAPGLMEMSEPGEYIAVCFIPVGSTPDAGEDVDGPPHFTQGMTHAFTVS